MKPSGAETTPRNPNALLNVPTWLIVAEFGFSAVLLYLIATSSPALYSSPSEPIEQLAATHVQPQVFGKSAP